MRVTDNTVDFARDAVQVARGLVGVAVVITTIPLQAYLIASDHATNDKYFNRPGSMRYNPNRPTPNTSDFPGGLPEDSAVRYVRTIQRIFTPN